MDEIETKYEALRIEYDREMIARDAKNINARVNLVEANTNLAQERNEDDAELHNEIDTAARTIREQENYYKCKY